MSRFIYTILPQGLVWQIDKQISVIHSRLKLKGVPGMSWNGKRKGRWTVKSTIRHMLANFQLSLPFTNALLISAISPFRGPRGGNVASYHVQVCLPCLASPPNKTPSESFDVGIDEGRKIRVGLQPCRKLNEPHFSHPTKPSCTFTSYKVLRIHVFFFRSIQFRIAGSKLKTMHIRSEFNPQHSNNPFWFTKRKD